MPGSHMAVVIGVWDGTMALGTTCACMQSSYCSKHIEQTVAMHNIIKGKVYFERSKDVKLTVLSAIHEMPIAMSDSTPGAMPYSTLG